jgi:DNA-binding beta-propeller fold protein YncE
VGEVRIHVNRAVVMGAVIATGIACTGSVHAAAAAAAVPMATPLSQGCSNPSDAVLEIRVATNTPERDIKVGRGGMPSAIATAPNGKTDYVVLSGDNEILPISTTTSKPGRVVKLGFSPDGIAIAPNGRTAYVADDVNDTVTPLSLVTGKKARAVKVGVLAGVIGISRNGRTVYVGNGLVETFPSATRDNAVVPISTATDKPGRTILVSTDAEVPGAADDFTFSPDGKTAYVSVAGASEVDPIRIASGTLGRPIRVGADPETIVFTPNRKTAYVADTGDDTVTPFNVATGKPGRAITIGARLGPLAATAAIAITPNGKTLYVGTNSDVPGEDDTVTPVSTATNRPGKAITVGQGIDAIAITPNGRTAYVASFNAGTVTPIRIAANAAGKPIGVGTDLGPATLAITPNGAAVYVADTAGCASATPPGDARS